MNIFFIEFLYEVRVYESGLQLEFTNLSRV